MLSSHKGLKKIWTYSKALAVYPNPELEWMIDDTFLHVNSLAIALIFRWNFYGRQDGVFEASLSQYRTLYQQLKICKLLEFLYLKVLIDHLI